MNKKKKTLLIKLQERVVENVEPKLQSTLRKIPFYLRDDVEQDIRIKILTSINNISFEEIPSIYEVN